MRNTYKHMNRYIKILSIIKNMKVHSFSNGNLILSSANKIIKINNLENPKPEILGEIPYSKIQLFLKNRTINRLLRNDIKLVYYLNDEDFLVCNRNGWFNFSDKIKISKVVGLEKTRPLARGVLTLSSGETFIGEYNQNKDREEISIFKSNDNIEFKTIYKFKKSEIRHVHGLIKDEKDSKKIWVLTGDKDDESHIYYTTNKFKSLTKFLSRGQLTRATDLVINNNDIIWGTDSPIKDNFIMKVNINKPSEMIKLTAIPGPVYYFCKNEYGGIYFGTTAEKGPSTEGRIARLFKLNENNSITELDNGKRDLIPQHGIYYLPRGILPKNYIVYSKRALCPNEGATIIAKDLTL